MIPSSRIKKMHFIGVGGAGMSGIAEILIKSGFEVTGSDPAESSVIQYLKGVGVKVYQGHDAKNVQDVDLVVYSSAINMDNPEIREAKKLRIPVIRRAEMLGELMRLKYTLAVCGTHGKTTTTSLLGHIWKDAGREPTIIVGGVVKNMGTGAVHGDSDVLIAEADEYDKSFLKMVPSMALITNIDEDHLECYGSMENLELAFIDFLNKVPFYGQIVACIDEEGVRKVLPEIRKPVISYGFSAQAKYRVGYYDADLDGCTFEVFREENLLGEINIPIPGKHNVKNALGAIALSLEEGLTFEEIRVALKSFGGVKRRFEHIASTPKFELYDDYAHHPTEVEATLAAARDNFQNKRVVIVFQPHLYSRTKACYQEFSDAFLNCDSLILCPVYGAREPFDPGVHSGLIGDLAHQKGHKDVHVLKEMKDVLPKLQEVQKQDDLILVMGAGPVWRLLNPIKEWGES
jgi:UDP-N-acetylmuramate--alanine ligase